MHKKTLLLSTLLLLLATAYGCEHDHESAEHEHNNTGENNSQVVPDALAMSACDALAQDPVALTAAETKEAAAGVSLMPHDGPHLITLPASGQGFLTVKVAVEHTDWAFFVREQGATATLTDPDGLTFVLHSPNTNLACGEDIAHDARHHLDLMGDYTLEINGGGAEAIWLIMKDGAAGHEDHDHEDHDHEDHDHG